MQNFRRIPVLLFAAILVFAAAPVPVSASPTAGDAGFSVKALIPDNQIDKSKTYFDLRMQPGQQQNLTVSINNPNSRDIDVTVEAITASTNRNGIINYTAPPEKSDQTLRYSFADLATVGEGQVRIPAGSSKEVKIAVAMPEQPYDGLILGSLRFLRLLSEEERNAAAMIVNQYSYVIAVRLRETDAESSPDFALGEIGPELVNYRAAITADIRNIVPEIVRDVTVSGQIFQKGSAAPLIERSQPGVEMAPNSVYLFSFVDEAGYGFAPGDYSANLMVEHGGRVWDFQQDFAIAGQEADQINTGALNQTQNGPTALDKGAPPVWMIVFIIAAFILLVVMGMILLRTRKGNREYEEYKKKRREK